MVTAASVLTVFATYRTAFKEFFELSNASSIFFAIFRLLSLNGFARRQTCRSHQSHHFFTDAILMARAFLLLDVYVTTF
jgi:hypothetical protein